MHEIALPLLVALVLLALAFDFLNGLHDAANSIATVVSTGVLKPGTAVVFAAFFNDAGGGKDDAGLAALGLLQAQGLAACTVAHASSRIGDAQSTLDDGIISHANAWAARMGIAAGQRCTDAVAAIGRGEADRALDRRRRPVEQDEVAADASWQQ